MTGAGKSLWLILPEPLSTRILFDCGIVDGLRQGIGESLVKTIFIHAFMDVHTFEVDRIKKCCTHYAMPDGRLMPGCAYNMFYRHKDPRYVGPIGQPVVWGKPA